MAAKALLLALGVAAIAHAQFASYDRLMADLMRRYNLPGGALAVTRNGKLLFAKGYGFADRDRELPVKPDSLFRIASISKPFTAVAILKLAEQGKLRLDDKAFSYLADLKPAKGATPDPRIASITIRQILHHTGGWDRDVSFDPMFRPVVAAEAVGEKPPASCRTVIRYMLGQKLDFDPGTRFAYSNFGFCVLGRIIEHVSGMPYDEFVKREVMAPAGITRMKIGQSKRSDDAAGEVHYYASGNAQPYGGFNLEAMDSHGGWIASAIDLVKFANAIDGRRGRPLLTPASIAELTSRPAPPLDQTAAAYYGLGLQIRPAGRDANWWHTGSLPGTTTLLVRTHHGYAWAAVFNSRPEGASKLPGDLDAGLWQAFGEVASWPDRDLFGEYR